MYTELEILRIGLNAPFGARCFLTTHLLYVETDEDQS